MKTIDSFCADCRHNKTTGWWNQSTACEKHSSPVTDDRGLPICLLYERNKGITVNSFTMRKGKVLPVRITVNMTDGIGIQIQGLNDISIKETLLRVTTAMMHLGYRLPGRKLIISISSQDCSHDISNDGGLDLPLAVALIEAAKNGQQTIPQEKLNGTLIAGELSLDAAVRGIKTDFSGLDTDKTVIVPAPDACKVSTERIKTIPVTTLDECLKILKNI